MRLLIVAGTANEVDDFSSVLESQVFPQLDCEIDLTVATNERPTRGAEQSDVALLAPGHPTQFADWAAALHRANPRLTVIAISAAPHIPAPAGLYLSVPIDELAGRLAAESTSLDAPSTLSTSSDDAPGAQLLNGRYEIIKVLGSGSLGTTYAARHRELRQQTVAVKVLFSDYSKDPTTIERFKNEIVASYEVSHPHVVRAYEFFRDGDIIAFTMEYVGGGDLAKLLADGPISIPEVVRLLKQICSGLQAIHDARIVHRDLKPENILLSEAGDIKISDFGISRAGSGPKLTEHGSVVGTIDYVSPEYLERGEVDLRSDVYSIGVIAYELVTGNPPYQTENLIESMTLRLRTDPVDPIIHRPDCPKPLAAIILKALARSPEQRFQTAQEMYDALLQQFPPGDNG